MLKTQTLLISKSPSNTCIDLFIINDIFQVGHTNPRTLVVKFAKYEKRGTSLNVNELQRSTVDEVDYDIAFTKEYFDEIRSEAPQGLGDVLMRTLIVLRDLNWSVQREGAVELHLRAVSSTYIVPLFLFLYDNSSSGKMQSA